MCVRYQNCTIFDRLECTLSEEREASSKMEHNLNLDIADLKVKCLGIIIVA